MIIETERLLLRPWREEDAEACFRYARDPDVGPAAGWEPHPDAEHSRTIIRTILSLPETYAVVLKETEEPVGSVGIMVGPASGMGLPEDEAELGCWIGKPFWGRGYIPEAIRALIRRCFDELGCSAVWYGFFEGNEKSRRVAEKCGFAYCRTLENTSWPVGVRTLQCWVLRKTDPKGPDA